MATSVSQSVSKSEILHFGLSVCFVCQPTDVAIVPNIFLGNSLKQTWVLRHVFAMAFPKSHGPPPREPPPSWVAPPSQRRSEESVFLRCREWEIQVPRSDIQTVVRTVIETDQQQASRMQFLQFQNQCLQYQVQQMQAATMMMMHQQLALEPDAQTRSVPARTLSDRETAPGSRPRSRSRGRDDGQTVHVMGGTRDCNTARGSMESRPHNLNSDPGQNPRPSVVGVPAPLDIPLTIPAVGLFYHKSESGGRGLIESNVGPLLPHVQRMTTTIGREPYISTIVEHQSSGSIWWTLPSLSVFSCSLLKHSASSYDWFRLYEILCQRRQLALRRDQSRLLNAFELGRIIEDSQGWIPNLQYYDRLLHFIPMTLSASFSLDLQEFLLQDLRHTYPNSFSTYEAHIRGVVQKMSEMLMLCPDNYNLVEISDLCFWPKTDIPLAYVAKLEPVTFKQVPPVSVAHSVVFGHNTQDTSWLTAVGFYARGTQSDKITPRSMSEVLSRAQKHAHYATARPICLLGITQGRQSHVTIHQGGVVAEHAANLYYDVVHSAKEKRWALRSHCSQLTHAAVLFPNLKQ